LRGRKAGGAVIGVDDFADAAGDFADNLPEGPS